MTTQYSTTLKLLMFSVFAIIPLYIIPSGGVHIVDVPIILLSVVVFLSARSDELETSMEIMAPLMPFLLWVVLVQTFYVTTSFDYKSYIMGAALMVYNFFILMIFTIVFRRVFHTGKVFSLLYLGLLVGCLTPWLMNTSSPLARWSLSFNNPNQLGYYAILMLSLLIFVGNETVLKGSKFKLWPTVAFCLVFLGCNGFAYIAESRAGVIGVGMLDLYVLIKVLRVYKVPAVLAAGVAGGILVSIYMGVVATRVPIQTYKQSDLLSRFEKKGLVDAEDMDHRILGMLKFKDDESIVIGNGAIMKQEGVTKVSRNYQKEVHNTLIGVLGDYGLIGSLLFIAGGVLFVYRLRIPDKWILMVPLVMYNMSHYGLRFRLLWITLSLIAIISHVRYPKKSSVKADIGLPMKLAPGWRDGSI